MFQNDNCTNDLKNRASFLGNGYIDNDESKEFVLCNIELSDVTVKDAGEWSCSMESYVMGDLSSGYKVTRSFNLKIGGYFKTHLFKILEYFGATNLFHYEVKS